MMVELRAGASAAPPESKVSMPKSFEYTPLFAWRAEARWAAGSGLRRAAPLLVFYGGMYEATPACPRPDAKSPCFVDRRESAAATGEQRGTRALRRLRKVGEHAASVWAILAGLLSMARAREPVSRTW